MEERVSSWTRRDQQRVHCLRAVRRECESVCCCCGCCHCCCECNTNSQPLSKSSVLHSVSYCSSMIQPTRPTPHPTNFYRMEKIIRRLHIHTSTLGHCRTNPTHCHTRLCCSPRADVTDCLMSSQPSSQSSLPRPSVTNSSSSASSHYAATRYRIAIVSDFFHPRLGGVELHQYSLAQALLQRGHTVIIVTGTYASPTAGQAQRQGVRYLTNGLKVYYCPHLSFHQQASIHTLYAFLPLLRCILLRERIQVLHAHQATSMLAHESILHAATLGLPCIYTDHSLFGFNSLSSIHLNKLLTFTLSLCSAAIAVSHCSKDNLCLRRSTRPAPRTRHSQRSRHYSVHSSTTTTREQQPLTPLTTPCQSARPQPPRLPQRNRPRH